MESNAELITKKFTIRCTVTISSTKYDLLLIKTGEIAKTWRDNGWRLTYLPKIDSSKDYQTYYVELNFANKTEASIPTSTQINV